MHLEIDGKTVRRHALDIVQAFYDVEFPQRSGHVQWPGVQARDLDAELPPVAGLGQGEVAQVKIQVELLIVNPVGVVDVCRGALDLLAEYRGRIEAIAHVLLNVLEAHRLVAQVRLVVEVDQADVGGTLGLLHEEEIGVFAVDLIHGSASVVWLVARWGPSSGRVVPQESTCFCQRLAALGQEGKRLPDMGHLAPDIHVHFYVIGMATARQPQAVVE